MLKIAYQLGIRMAFEEAGLLKEGQGAMSPTAQAAMPTAAPPTQGVGPMSPGPNPKMPAMGTSTPSPMCRGGMR